MTKSYPDECLERAEKATEGPWLHYHYGQYNGVEASSRADICCMSNSDWQADDSIADNIAFIAHARTDVVELATRLKRQVDGLRIIVQKLVYEGNEGYTCIHDLEKLIDELETPLQEGK